MVIIFDRDDHEESSLSASGSIKQVLMGVCHRNNNANLVFRYKYALITNCIFSSYTPNLSVSVPMIKLTAIALRINTVKLECIILMRESLKYVSNQF